MGFATGHDKGGYYRDEQVFHNVFRFQNLVLLEHSDLLHKLQCC